MKCDEIKSLLFEYVEGTLDNPEKRAVEKHIKTCDACGKELAAARSYFLELDRLEEVKVPKDFLATLHTRLQQRAGRKRLIRLFFFPLGLKVPIEATAALAMILMVIFLFKGEPPSEQLAYRDAVFEEKTGPGVHKDAPLSEGERAPEKSRSHVVAPPVEDKEALELEMKVEEIPPSVKEKDLQDIQEKKRIEDDKTLENELSFILDEPETKAKVPAEGEPAEGEETTLEQKPLPAAQKTTSVEEQRVFEVALVVKTAPSEDYDVPAGSENFVPTAKMEGKKMERAESSVGADPFDETAAAPFSLDKTLLLVKDLVEGEGGEILALDLKTEGLSVITARIPRSNLDIFFEKLSRLGDLSLPQSPLSETEAREPFELRIRISFH
jgi:hypothetical protein